jgi:type VI secretion system secreted protein Hcp
MTGAAQTHLEATMATDTYLKIDGIAGESTDSGHQGWIEILSGGFGIHQPRSACVSTGGGHTAERVNMSEIHFSKLVDLASPILMQMCAAGKTHPKASIELMRADGANKPIKYLEILLEEVMIASYSPSFGAGVATETGSLSFAKIQMRYTQQKVSGGITGNTAGGWDLAQNKLA